MSFTFEVKQAQEQTKEQPVQYVTVLNIDTKRDTTVFTPNGVKALIHHYYTVLSSSRYPSFPALLLIGPPGVGKSTAVREAAQEIAAKLGRKFVDITSRENRYMVLSEIESCLSKGDRRAVQSCLDEKGYFVFLDLRLTEVEPSDLIGIPYRIGDKLETSKMEYTPPIWALILHYLPGILFLDEISNVNRPDVMSVAYKLLLDRAAGFVDFNRGVMVVAAGNLPGHAPGLAQSLPPPVINRSSVALVEAPSVDEWYKWMVENLRKAFTQAGEDGAAVVNEQALSEHMDTLNVVYAFLSNFPEHFLSLKYDPKTNENFPTPRSWSHFVFTTPTGLIRSLVASGKYNALLALISSYVGSETAEEFLPILKEGSMIDVDKIIENPKLVGELIDEAPDTGSKINRLIALVGMVPAKIRNVIHDISSDTLINITSEVIAAGDKIRKGLGCSAARSMYIPIFGTLVELAGQRKLVGKQAKETPVSKVSKLGFYIKRVCGE